MSLQLLPEPFGLLSFDRHGVIAIQHMESHELSESVRIKGALPGLSEEAIVKGGLLRVPAIVPADLMIPDRKHHRHLVAGGCHNVFGPKLEPSIPFSNILQQPIRVSQIAANRDKLRLQAGSFPVEHALYPRVHWVCIPPNDKTKRPRVIRYRAEFHRSAPPTPLVSSGKVIGGAWLEIAKFHPMNPATILEPRYLVAAAARRGTLGRILQILRGGGVIDDRILQRLHGLEIHRHGPGRIILPGEIEMPGSSFGVSPQAAEKHGQHQRQESCGRVNPLS